MNKTSFVPCFNNRLLTRCILSWRIQTVSLPVFSRFLTISLLCLGTLGCSSMVARQVPDSQRDQSGKFDGMWRGKVTGGGSVQYVGSQGLRCSKRNRGIRFQVTDGVIRAVSGMPAGEERANVSAEGKFRLEVPTDGEYSGGGFLVQKPGVTLVVQGNLAEDAQKGLYVVGMGQLNNEGCSYRVGFESTDRKSKSRKKKKYTNKYKGLFVGVTSRGTVVSRLGEPVAENSPGRFSFSGDIDITFNEDENVNTIIIYKHEYKDRHGMNIGMSVDDLKGIAGIDIRDSDAVDEKHGIVYRLDELGKVKEIVLVSESIDE